MAVAGAHAPDAQPKGTGALKACQLLSHDEVAALFRGQSISIDDSASGDDTGIDYCVWVSKGHELPAMTLKLQRARSDNETVAFYDFSNTRGGIVVFRKGHAAAGAPPMPARASTS